MVSAQCGEVLGDGPVDLALVFASAAHVDAMESLVRRVRESLKPECVLAVTGEGVVGGRIELERTPGVSILAARLPGVSVHPFTGEELMQYYDESPEGLSRVARVLGADESLRASIILADPFTVPINRLLPALNRARARGQVGAIVGGMASAGPSHGSNVLALNDRFWRSGLVGVSLKGPIRVDTVVSQGCRGVGPTLVVTAATRNVILKLGGRPALEVVRELVESMSDEDKKLLERGLFLGRVVNEYKERFGRDDFLIRNVVGVEESQGAMSVNDVIRVGTTVRFHLRDARTADEDLALLLDAQKLRDPPLGGLLVTCNGRGERFFEQPNHDATAVVRAFSPATPAEQKAKPGMAVEPAVSAGAMPVAGFFAAGEIGPVGGESHVHGYTACLTLFRAER